MKILIGGVEKTSILKNHSNLRETKSNKCGFLDVNPIHAWWSHKTSKSRAEWFCEGNEKKCLDEEFSQKPSGNVSQGRIPNKFSTFLWANGLEVSRRPKYGSMQRWIDTRVESEVYDAKKCILGSFWFNGFAGTWDCSGRLWEIAERTEDVNSQCQSDKWQNEEWKLPSCFAFLIFSKWIIITIQEKTTLRLEIWDSPNIAVKRGIGKSWARKNNWEKEWKMWNGKKRRENRESA